MEKRVHNTDDAKLAAPNAKALVVRDGSHDRDEQRGNRSSCAIAALPPRVYSIYRGSHDMLVSCSPAMFSAMRMTVILIGLVLSCFQVSSYQDLY